jgi:hypothetical protein
MTDESPFLLPQHAELLREAGIPGDVIAARGYQSLTTKAEVRSLGFTDRQCLVPALRIPLRGPGGEVVSWQIRPDQPRNQQGMMLETELPASPRILLDVPSSALDRLAGDEPLVIAASVIVADAAAVQGLTALSLHGGPLAPGQHHTHGVAPDWSGITLQNRTVLLDGGLLPAAQQIIARHRNGQGAAVHLLGDPVMELLAADLDLTALVDLALPWTPPAEKEGPDRTHRAGLCGSRWPDRLEPRGDNGLARRVPLELPGRHPRGDHRRRWPGGTGRARHRRRPRRRNPARRDAGGDCAVRRPAVGDAGVGGAGDHRGGQRLP